MTSTIYTVSQMNTYIRNMFTQDYLLQKVTVKGEVSNCTYHSSGHLYFSIKDDKGVLACIMFASHRSGLSFRLEEGSGILATGSVQVYEQAGKYQLYVTSVVADGLGQLKQRYEAIRMQLLERGMFDPLYKKPIPPYVQTLGIVTAPTGAAVWDMIRVATRRNPYVQIWICPAIVQGDLAVESVIRGIKELEKRKPDVIIVGRGGGSIEDLWAFNDERLAEAVFACQVPIISAVGHETDFTIIDEVADLRAATPSVAAELAVFDIRSWEEAMKQYERRLKSGWERRLMQTKHMLEQKRMRLLHTSLDNQIKEHRRKAKDMKRRLCEAMEQATESKRHQMALYAMRLDGLSPVRKLAAGWVQVTDMQERIVRDVSQLEVNQCTTLHFVNGNAVARIVEINKMVANASLILDQQEGQDDEEAGYSSGRPKG